MPLRIIFFSFIIIAIGVLLGQAVTLSTPLLPLFVVIGLFVFLIAFFHSELALVLVIFASLLSPEFVVGSIPGRDINVRLEDFLLIIFVLAWFARIAVMPRLPMVVKTPLNRQIGLYAAIFVISTMKGIIFADVRPLPGIFYILKYMQYFFIFYLVANNLWVYKSKKLVQIYITCFVLTFVIVTIYAWYQMGTMARVSAPFEGEIGEPNTLGGYQVLITAVLLGIVLHIRSLPWKFFLLSLCALTVPPFLYTLSRSSYLSAAVLAVSLWIFVKRKRMKLFISLVLCMAAIGLFMPQKIYDRIEYTFTPHATQHNDAFRIGGVALGPSATERVLSWINVYKRWKENPYLGRGVTSLGFIDGQYARTLVELGLLGLIAFFMMLFQIYRVSRRIYDQTQDLFLKGIAGGFLVGHIAMVCHALTANTYIIIRIMEPYWFLAGIVVMIPHIEKQMNLKKKQPDDIKPRALV